MVFLSTDLISDKVQVYEVLMLLVDLILAEVLMVLRDVWLQLYTEEVDDHLADLLPCVFVDKMFTPLERFVAVSSFSKEVAHRHFIDLCWTQWLTCNQNAVFLYSLSSWPKRVELKVNIRSLLTIAYLRESPLKSRILTNPTLKTLVDRFSINFNETQVFLQGIDVKHVAVSVVFARWVYRVSSE